MIQALLKMSLATTNHTLHCEPVRNLLQTADEHFDVIVLEVFLNEAMLGFGQHFGAPIVAFSPFGASKATSDMVGTPSPLSYVPHVMLPFTDEMNFLERFANTLLYIFETYMFNIVYFPEHITIYNRAFPSPKPALNSIRTNVSLVLLNTDYTLNYPRPYMTNMIEVGGLHVNLNRQKLPENIQNFLDTAPNGAIYFSMGSNIQSASLPIEKRLAIINVFAKLKQRVLWKWEDSKVPNLSANVMTSKWLPQEDILAHPNLRLFISHGGYLSSTETIHYGVPLIGIPVYGDQSLNMARAVLSGYGVSIDYTNLTESSLQWAIDEILNNNK